MQSIRRVSAFLTIIALLLPTIAQGQVVERLPNKKTPIATTCDVLTCQLPKELFITERFLRDRKNGLPFTPDPRPLTPFLEVVRLNQLSQTMGYVNIYEKYRTTTFRDEALNRVNYFLDLGTSAYGNGPRDGMIAYMFLEAYRVFGDTRYLQAGVAIADACAALPDRDMVMNGGLMCALGLGAAFQATGNTTYRDASRRVTTNTTPKLFPDGTFPHLPTLAGGKNIGYTTWMNTELMLLGGMDPLDPFTDFLTRKTAERISTLIDPKGNLIIHTETENFGSDPGNENTGYGPDVAGLFSLSLSMVATNHYDIARRTLANGFSHRKGGLDYGGYPDVYNPTEWPITNIWASGNPSVLRTSLIFWYMSMFPKFMSPCSNGPVQSCVATTQTCTPEMQVAGVCAVGEVGTQQCLGGRYSACASIPAVTVESGNACGEAYGCEQRGNSACYQTCTLYGSKICRNGICAEQCYDVNIEGQPSPTCTESCIENQFCGDFLQQPISITDTDSMMCRML